MSNIKTEMNVKRYLCIDCAPKSGYALTGMKFTLATCNDCGHRGIAALEEHYQNKIEVMA